MSITRKKLYSSLIVYVIALSGLLISRILDYGQIPIFSGVAVVFIVFSAFVKTPQKEIGLEIKERKKSVISTLLFTALLLFLIPLTLLGDYVCSKTPLGYDIAFVNSEVDGPFIWMTAGVFAIGAEMFFRNTIYNCFADIVSKKRANIITSLMFSLLFMDIRLFVPMFVSGIILTLIGYVSDKFRYIFSVLLSLFTVVMMFFLSVENGGGAMIGIKNIVGMLLIFSSIGIGCAYGGFRMSRKREVSYIETMMLCLIIFVILLVGCAVVSL